MIKKWIYETMVLIGLLSVSNLFAIEPGTVKKALFGFVHPQDSTRTKTWWLHGETETTREGITADLEAFKKAGLGGVIYYDQSHGNAENACDGFSAKWWSMLRFAAEEAKRLGLSFEVSCSNGFVAGGKWITPEYGMQRLVETNTLIHGGKRFVGKLAAPTSQYSYLKEVAVLAFPAPKEGIKSTLNLPITVTSNQLQNAIELFNINDRLTKIPAQTDGKPVYVNIDFGQILTIRSISYEVRPKGKATTSATNVPAPPADTFVGTGYRILPDLGQLEVSSDGIHYSKVCDLKPIYKAHESWRQKTISFPKVSGRYYRLNLHDWAEKLDPSPDMLLGNIIISSMAKVDQYEEKSALFSEYIEKDRTPDYDSDEVVHSSSILNLTTKMTPDGTLTWDVPAGDWVVMRFAHVPTGGISKHGRKNLMGLECDKLSAKAAEWQWNHYYKVILDSLRATNSGHVNGMIMDSHEAGSQNWTENFIPEFIQRRGYDPTLYLPSMCGYVVDNRQETIGFLQDIRRNIADMIADNYYGTLDSLCRQEGTTLTAQATGNALCIVADPIQAKGRVEKPQGEFWPIHPDGNYDIKESSSAAHLYDKKIASAEAFTDAKFSHSLSDLKSFSDYAYAFGINEFVICASAYQPWLDKIPGSTGGGRHYCINRNNTWWNYSHSFWDYQSRSAYLMRQGKPKVDLCVYLGENAPVKILTYRLPNIPGGYDFDACTTDALLSRMEAEEGNIVLPNGIYYRLMILPRNGEITLRALKKIVSLVTNGAVVYGPKAVFSENHETEKKEEFEYLVHQLWGDSLDEEGSHSCGKGKVYWGMSLENALTEAGIQPDITMEKGNTKDSKIYFAHRRLSDGELYFLHNHKSQKESTTFKLASNAQRAELWNPVTGERFRIPMIQATDTTSVMRLDFEPMESYFVVLSSEKEDIKLPLVSWMENEKEMTIKGPWKVGFEQRMGGPAEEITFTSLSDWTANENPQIKYYSGTAIYKKTIFLKKPISNERVYLQLDHPIFAINIYVNGLQGKTIWCSPWECEITDLLKKGENELELHVCNSLMNRMIGDYGLPKEKRVTYCYPEIVMKNDSLISSGIIGNVKIVTRKTK